jgi:hypothetical protein
VYDADLGIDEQIRIVKLQKGIRDGYNIQIELSNTVSRSTLQRIAGEIREINNQVVVSNQANKQRGIEAYQRTRELQQMVFDPDGYFDTDNIRPLSIQTGMLSVGAKSQQYQLSNLLQPNYNGNPQSMYWSAGLLTHFSLLGDQVKEWVIASGNITITGDNQTRALYIYARCSRSGSTGDIYLSENAFKFDSDTTYWYFLVGILHTPVSDVRGISLSYGQTTINGQFIRTGVISSVDRSTYFNLNTGEIGGNIKFIHTGGGYTDVGEKFEEVEANVTYKVEVISTNGNSFRNDNIETTLIAVVYRGKEDITATLPNGAFRWIRKSDNAADDIIWNNIYSTYGSNILMLTHEDVEGRAVFNCEVTIIE